ncbi:unnamed protein product [Parajaminaea phylloscopi]
MVSKKENQQNGKPEAPKQRDDGKVEPPYTGWKGETPGSKGGSEEGYMLKPPYFWQSDEFKVDFTAGCWCGKVKLEYSGLPFDAKHCHCDQCKRLHGAPFQWACLFFKNQVRLHHSTDPIFVDFFSTQTKTGEHNVPTKVSCRQCRSPLFDEGRRVVLAYPSSFDFKDGKVPKEFAPTCHIFYGEAIIEVDDGVPKWSGHKNDSELLPHVKGEHGKLGKGATGQQRAEEHANEEEGRRKKARHDQDAMEKKSIEEPGTEDSPRAPTKKKD